MPSPRTNRRQEESDILDPHFFSPDGACYNEKRDGSLEEYLRERDNGGTTTFFKGLEHFNLLHEKGWLAPRMSFLGFAGAGKVVITSS